MMKREGHFFMVKISSALIELILTDGYLIPYPARCLSGIPDGSILVGACFADEVLALIFEHDSYPIVGAGDEMSQPVVIFSREDRQTGFLGFLQALWWRVSSIWEPR